jgi:hypothetical protein
MIARLIFVEEYKSCSYSLCIRSIYLASTSFSTPYGLCSSGNVIITTIITIAISLHIIREIVIASDGW